MEGRCNMTLTNKKLILIGTIATLLLLANLWELVAWLDRVGLIGWAERLEMKYLTGTAITVIVVLLILLPSHPSTEHRGSGPAQRCRVCRRPAHRAAKYCAGCGSRIGRARSRHTLHVKWPH